MRKGAALLEINNLCKIYGEKHVLWNFTYNLGTEGTVALLGPSGCGKTTLLRLLAGLEQSDYGQIILPPQSRISMVFQEDRLLPGLTALENILSVMGKADGGKRGFAGELLEQMGLDGSAGEYPGNLSGGMKRRVAIARALAYDGDILLLDEPFKGLDAVTRNLVMKTVFHAKRQKPRLTLFVTHQPGEAEQVADIILTLRGIPMEIIGEKRMK